MINFLFAYYFIITYHTSDGKRFIYFFSFFSGRGTSRTARFKHFLAKKRS